MAQESGLAGAFSQAAFGNSAGVKLEAVMEQLQRQQQAKLEMERKERHLREAHILYAQQLAAQQAIMASARAQGTPLSPDFYSKNSRDRALKAGQGPPAPRGPVKSSAEMEEDASDEMDRGRGSEGDEEDDDEMMDGDDVSEDEESEGLEFLRKQSLALQQAAVGVPSYPYQVYAASPSAAKKRARSPTTKVKDEPEDSLSDQQSFSTPNGLGDWNLDDSFKQVCVYNLVYIFTFARHLFQRVFSMSSILCTVTQLHSVSFMLPLNFITIALQKLQHSIFSFHSE